MIVLIIGQIGTGKTFLNDSITREISRRNPKLAVLASRLEGFEGTLLPANTKCFIQGADALDYIEQQRSTNFLLSISETQEVAGSRADQYDPRMQKLIFRGRHIGANIIADTQRAVRITTDLFSQAHDTYSFRQELPQDLDRVEDYAIHPGAREIVQTLPDRAFYSFRSGRIYELG